MHSHRGVGCYQVSITLRWHRCFRQVFINNDVSKPFAGVYERKVVKYIVNELLMPECYLLSVLYTLLPDLSTCTADLFLIILREAECPKASPPAGYHQPNRPPNTLLAIPTIPPINPLVPIYTTLLTLSGFQGCAPVICLLNPAWEANPKSSPTFLCSLSIPAL